MDAARSAIGKITGRTGHKTDVDETVNPSVTSETIKPHRHEETTEAIDREVHQDHYHTTVQPISHREVLPEQHTHNLAPQVNREFRHGDDRETQQRVNSELGQFQNSSTTRATTQSTAAAPSVTGEHVHHHVHETVQPVIHKETYQPEVVHTTVPIHETHHQKATHHGMSALPMKTLDEFKSSGGVLQGGQRSATHEEYDGAPRPYNEKLSTTIEKVLPGHHHQSGNVASGTTGGYGTTSGQNYGEDSFGRGNTTTTTNTTTSTNTQKFGQMGEHDRSNLGNTSTTGSQYTDSRDTSGSQQNSKPSLMDKLNPKIDSDGDGKAGFMK